jgi:Raf kinase inhibitor-like YbhB/YbcL family protein
VTTHDALDLPQMSAAVGRGSRRAPGLVPVLRRRAERPLSQTKNGPPRRAVVVSGLLLPLLAACGGGETVSGPPPSAPARIALESPAFTAGATIPRRYTCAGAGVSPPLRWHGVPARARALALLVEDPDAPGATFVHWTLYGLSPGLRSLRAGAVPAGARQGASSAGDTGWTPPCPPHGDPPHRYVFTLYALSAPLRLAAGADPGRVRTAVARAAVARGELVGRVQRR